MLEVEAKKIEAFDPNHLPQILRHSFPKIRLHLEAEALDEYARSSVEVVRRELASSEPIDTLATRAN